MQKLSLIDRWREDPDGFIIINGNEKDGSTNNSLDNNSIAGGFDSNISGRQVQVNGGKGSGNFGHAGRPGKVGGSSPSESSSPALTDEQEAKVQEWTRTIKRGELIQKIRRLKKSDKFEELVQEMLDAGFTRAHIDTWRDWVKKQEEKHQVETEKKRELRKRAQESPEQTAAIDNVIEKIVVRPQDVQWLRKNCSPEMAKAFSDEVDKAEKFGIKNVKLFLNDKEAKQGELGFLPSTDTYSLQISKKILRDQEKTQATRQRSGPNGSRWWTSDKIEGTFAHEFGHCMEWEFLKKFMGPEKKLANGQSVLKSNYFLPKVRDYCSQLIVNQAKENLSKKGVSLDELRENKDYKYMSNYGKTNQFEAIAESFGNPDYSPLTKEIYNITMGNKKLNKQRIENLKKSIEVCEERLSRMKF